jgi:hypothetical protein
MDAAKKQQFTNIITVMRGIASQSSDSSTRMHILAKLNELEQLLR